MDMFGKMGYNVFRKSIANIGVILALAVVHAHADTAPIVEPTQALCPAEEYPDLLTCINARFSDLQVETVPRSLDTGFEYPELGGIYTSVQRHKRSEDGTEIKIESISDDDLTTLRSANDPANAYRVLSINPTARNLFLSLDLLALEVLPQAPTEAPAAYLFLMKAIESTLYAAAIEDDRPLYAVTESFRNCVQLTLIDRDPDRMLDTCWRGLRSHTYEIAPEIR